MIVGSDGLAWAGWVLAGGLSSAGTVWLLCPVDPTVRLRRVFPRRGGGVPAMRWAGVLRPLPARLPLGPRGRRRRTVQRARAIGMAVALVAELRAGQPVRHALIRAAGAEPDPVCPRALAALAWGGDVAAALRVDADRSGVSLLRSLAACWEVGESSGAGLAAAVERLASSARTAEDVRASLEAQLAQPRATARLLATLPAIGLAFGILLGAEPLAWLTGTAAGLACLVVGVGLTVVGLAWTGRIASRVERLL